jgi:hypothetical protein
MYVCLFVLTYSFVFLGFELQIIKGMLKLAQTTNSKQLPEDSILREIAVAFQCARLAPASGKQINKTMNKSINK